MAIGPNQALHMQAYVQSICTVIILVCAVIILLAPARPCMRVISATIPSFVPTEA